MSRFKGTYRPEPVPATAAVTAAPTPARASVADPITFAATPFAPMPAAPIEQPFSTGLAHRFGFFFLAVYVLAGVVNEALHRLSSGTSYLTAICLVVLPLLLIFNGRLMEAIHVSIGKLWILFSLWLLLDVATSIWKGGSLSLLWGYLPKAVLVFFFVTSFVATITQNRRLMNINIFASFLLVLNCAAFGSMKTGRLEIPDSLFFENANDLGLSLLLGLCQTAYLFYIPGIKSKLWGGLVATASLYFMLKTGSRGDFAALLLTGCVAFFMSRQKILFGALGTLALVVLLIATPGDMRSRLTFIISDAGKTGMMSEEELGSYGSQMQREQLLRQSLQLTLEHPVFGVGPGQFAVAVFENAKKENKHAPWLGTHNSYTEVSSECGLPALFLYVGIILWTLKTSFRIYRKASVQPSMYAVTGLSCALVLGTVAFASGTFFFHVAYTGYLPMLSGSVLALRDAVQRRYHPSFAPIG